MSYPVYPGRRQLLPLLLTLSAMFSFAVQAQKPFVSPALPGEERPAVPEFRQPELEEPLHHPPTPAPPQVPEGLPTTPRVFVSRFELEGNTVFSDGDLSTVTQGYLGRRLSTQDLETVRRELTRYYIDRGYINSGAVIPDQDVKNGVLHIRIIEGILTTVNIDGNSWLSQDYLRKRIELGAGPPLRLDNLGDRLMILQQSPLIDRLSADLQPDLDPGTARLEVQVTEAPPIELYGNLSNIRSPAVGAEQADLHFIHHSLTRHGDKLELGYGITEGLNEWRLRYGYPLNARDTTLELDYQNTSSDVVEKPFDDLQIENDSEDFAVRLNHPVFRSVDRELLLSLSLEKRRSQSDLLGEPFSFSPGADDGEVKLTILRFAQQWLDRSTTQVIAARSLFSLGMDAWDATNVDPNQNATFLSWLGQFQWVKLIRDDGTRLLFRADLQLTDSSLFPIERYSIGGLDTVRGYRENEVVTDNAWVVSLELRVPVFEEYFGPGKLQFAPFIDMGRGWNEKVSTPEPDYITGVGAGFRWKPAPGTNVMLYAGIALRNVDHPGTEHDLQDDGIHFLLSHQLF